MTSVERVKTICKKRKIPISRLERDLGFSNGYIGQLKKGAFPDDRLIKVANYLDVSVEYLTSGTEKNVLTLKDERDIAKDLENIMAKLCSGENGPASFEGTDIPEEDREMFAGQVEIMLRRLKTINKEKYNPHKNKK